TLDCDRRAGSPLDEIVVKSGCSSYAPLNAAVLGVYIPGSIIVNFVVVDFNVFHTGPDLNGFTSRILKTVIENANPSDLMAILGAPAEYRRPVVETITQVNSFSSAIMNVVVMNGYIVQCKVGTDGGNVSTIRTRVGLGH